MIKVINLIIILQLKVLNKANYSMQMIVTGDAQVKFARLVVRFHMCASSFVCVISILAKMPTNHRQ